MTFRLLCLACIAGTCWAIYANTTRRMRWLQWACLAGEVAVTAWGGRRPA